MGNVKAIGEGTMIPLTWAVGGLTTLIIPLIVGSMWVRGVNDRLSRIEQKLHIEPLQEESEGIIPHAFADPKK